MFVFLPVGELGSGFGPFGPGLGGVRLGKFGCASTAISLRVLPPANPTSGAPVKIAQVNDRRAFPVNPRTIAREGNVFGKAASGDILLPEGQTVPQLVGDALTRAFRESGYRVLLPGDSGYEEASAITADVDQFWTWFTPSWWTIMVEFRADVRIQGEIGPFQNGGSIQGSARESGMVATSDMWNSVMDQGVEDLIRNLRATLENR